MVGELGLGKTFDKPTSFFVFEQGLLEFANNDVKHNILSLIECRHVGARLKMSDEWWRLSSINRTPFSTLDMSFPITSSSSHKFLLAFSHKVSVGTFKGFPVKIITHLNKGIITKELLGCDKISSYFEKGFNEFQNAIKLFCHTFALAPLQSDNPKAATHSAVFMTSKECLMIGLMPAIPDLN